MPLKLIEEGAAGYFEKGSMTQEKRENAISGILKKRLLVLMVKAVALTAFE